MPVTDRSIPSLLKKQADQRPNETAFTFLDYDLDPNGFAKTLTWSQVHARACVVADELTMYGVPGDRVARVAILAPQGLEYIVAFLGALQAGFIGVPLSTPQYGVHDERVSAVLRDSQPVAILTTSAVVGDVTKYASSQDG
ncbi:AMP-binding protein, partial [Mycolicibacterium setense]